MEVYWLEQAQAEVPPDNGWLSSSEAARLAAFRIPKRIADWRLGRWTAKLASAAYLRLPATSETLKSLEIRPDSMGAPELFIAGKPASATISLTHRAGVAACAIASSAEALGCDLELLEPREGAFIADFFTPDEQNLIASADETDRPALVTLLWSAKESALKALREGLRLDTRSVNVKPFSQHPQRKGPQKPNMSSADGNWSSLMVDCGGGQSLSGWWQHTGDRLRTLVAAPPPLPPSILKL